MQGLTAKQLYAYRRRGSHNYRETSRGVIVPIHSDDIPTGTLRSIERQGEPALGRMWLRRGFLHG